MARKDRAPDPPRRPQAPQRRSTPTSPADTARRRRLLYITGAAALVAVAVVLGVAFLAGGGEEGDDQNIVATMEAAGCEVKAAQAQSGVHSAELDATDDPKWNTDPPTSGPHNDTPAVYGEYDTELRIAQVVHNLEHGAMYIFYGPDVPEATVGQLRELYAEDRLGILLAPYPKLDDKIALGAWNVPDDFEPGSGEGTGYLAMCPTYEEDAFRTFRDELRFKGPERFPPESLQPGST